MALILRGKTWHIDIEIVGQPRIRRTTGTQNKREAQRIHDQVKASALAVKKSGKTLSDALILWLKQTERSASDKSAIRIFLQKYPNRPLSEVNQYDIQDAFINESPSTYNRRINVIRAAIKLATERQWCEPITLSRRKTSKSKLRFLKPEEWATLKAHLKPYVLAPATFAISTGLRKSNVFNLQWQNVDLQRKVVMIHPDEFKSGEPLTIPLNDEAVSVLRAQIGKHQTNVFTLNGQPLKDVKKAWKAALVNSNIDVVTRTDSQGKKYNTSTFRWHDLRRTWASWHIMNKTPREALQKLGGWSTAEMVEIYAQLDPNYSERFVNNVTNYGT